MPTPFDLAGLRRFPDVEAPELLAVDAADRLILDESAAAHAGAGDGELVVIGDSYGALTLAAAADGCREIRVHQDPLRGERALAGNARTFGLEETFRSMPLGADLVRGARAVLLRLPRSLEELDDIAAVVAADAAPDVVVFAGGRLKHMTRAMNDVLGRHFARVDVSLARQKSRVLSARSPLPNSAEPAARCETHPMPGDERGTRVLRVCAFGGVFAGPSIDIGTRFLLEHLPPVVDARHGPAIDFASGSGVIASWLALRHPELQVYASDQSAAAVASTRATAEANGVAAQVTVARDDGLSLRADASAAFMTLNPPFHTGATVQTGLAAQLFAEAARVLMPGGDLWTVWNSPLPYRAQLERLVGPTRQVARNAKFTVTVSTRA